MTTENDWTTGPDGRSSSPLFEDMRRDVTAWILDNARNLLYGNASDVAGIIISHLAHAHGLRPATEGQSSPAPAPTGDVCQMANIMYNIIQAAPSMETAAMECAEAALSGRQHTPAPTDHVAAALALPREVRGQVTDALVRARLLELGCADDTTLVTVELFGADGVLWEAGRKAPPEHVIVPTKPTGEVTTEDHCDQCERPHGSCACGYTTDALDSVLDKPSGPSHDEVRDAAIEDIRANLARETARYQDAILHAHGMGQENGLSTALEILSRNTVGPEDGSRTNQYAKPSTQGTAAPLSGESAAAEMLSKLEAVARETAELRHDIATLHNRVAMLTRGHEDVHRRLKEASKEILRKDDQIRDLQIKLKETTPNVDRTISVREAARRRLGLGGPDAQALEGALQQAERECEDLRRQLAEHHGVIAGLQAELQRAELVKHEELKPLAQVGERLLRAAMDYWEAANPVVSGAVKWREDDDGRLVVLTRGEYREAILRNVVETNKWATHTFGEGKPKPLAVGDMVEIRLDRDSSGPVWVTDTVNEVGVGIIFRTAGGYARYLVDEDRTWRRAK